MSRKLNLKTKKEDLRSSLNYLKYMCCYQGCQLELA